MAKQPKAQPRDDAALNNSTVEMDEKKFVELCHELMGHQGDISSATGRLRSTLKEYLKETGHHKGAVGDIRKIDNMTETARADYLRTFLPYLEAMLAKRWKKQQPDFLDGD
jgi:hypothetical protein